MEKCFSGVAPNGIKWHQTDSFLPDFAVVKADNEHLYNYIDKNGNLLSEEWFWMVEYMFDSADGMALVIRSDNETGVKTRNFIDTQGHIVMPKWTTHYPYEYKNGITLVANYDYSLPWWRGFNFLDEQGNLISSHWLERAWLTDEYDGYIGEVCLRDSGFFLIDKLGYFTPLKAFTSDSNEVKKYRFDELYQFDEYHRLYSKPSMNKAS